MAEIPELLSEYIAEHRAGGEADPRAYLERVEGFDRAELATLIDTYLARSPGQAWDAETYKGSAAERAAEEISRSLRIGAAGWWPTVLPRLRNQFQLTRGQVVDRLSAALGATGREQKVASYYHRMEHGTLDSAGVSDRVLVALAEIYETTAATLREIGAPIGEGREPGEEMPALARTAFPDETYERESGEDESRAKPVAPTEERDEIDDLFTGGL
jgi:hypothetical protein